jgi:hypothetical protein
MHATTRLYHAINLNPLQQSFKEKIAARCEKHCKPNLKNTDAKAHF